MSDALLNIRTGSLVSASSATSSTIKPPKPPSFDCYRDQTPVDGAPPVCVKLGYHTLLSNITDVTRRRADHDAMLLRVQELINHARMAALREEAERSGRTALENKDRNAAVRGNYAVEAEEAMALTVPTIELGVTALLSTSLAARSRRCLAIRSLAKEIRLLPQSSHDTDRSPASPLYAFSLKVTRHFNKVPLVSDSDRSTLRKVLNNPQECLVMPGKRKRGLYSVGNSDEYGDFDNILYYGDTDFMFLQLNESSQDSSHQEMSTEYYTQDDELLSCYDNYTKMIQL
ncbi:hypothetical protein EDC01DRAFT_627757 [Geopyxis carbonaria]|nr:hypothetical protein EDC01DRAFT_627757 [Geopyxis carbonaria]